MQTLMGFMLAMSVTMVLIPLLMRWAVPLGFLDIPDARKHHAMPIPRVGGVAMVVGVLLALPLLGVATRPMQALVACIATLAVFGVWDDRVTLSAAPKFLGQALAVLIAMLWGGVSIGSMTFMERLPLPDWLALPVTFFFLLGGTNAFNLADGLDGLAGGMAMLCLCGTALLAYTVGKPAIGGAAVVMVAALIGFLRFNTHPARVFMGDGGSQMLGFSAASLAILLTQDPKILLSTALPLLLLGMPIIDTVMVMVERLLAGHSPFLADRRHIHYRLLALGFEHWEAVSVLYLLQGGLFVTAWFLRYASDLPVILSFVGFAMVVVVPLRTAERLGLRVRRARPATDSARVAGLWAAASATALMGAPAVLSRVGSTPKAVLDPPSAGGGGANAAAAVIDMDADVGGWPVLPSLQSLAPFVLAAALAAYAVWVLMTGARLSRDMQILALSLVTILAVGLLLRWRRADAAWTDKVALYSCAALAIFLDKHGVPGVLQLHVGAAPTHLVECVLYIVLAAAVLACIPRSGERPFRLTPLDILVLLVVATVPNLPNSVASARSLGLTIAELVLLFYSLEALALVLGSRWRWISAAAVLFLVGLVLRAGI